MGWDSRRCILISLVHGLTLYAHSLGLHRCTPVCVCVKLNGLFKSRRARVSFSLCMCARQNTQGYGTDGYTTEDSCEGCHRRYTPGSGSQRCTPRRRVVSGGLNRYAPHAPTPFRTPPPFHLSENYITHTRYFFIRIKNLPQNYFPYKTNTYIFLFKILDNFTVKILSTLI